MSAQHCRSYLEMEIASLREQQEKLMSFAEHGRLPRPRNHVEPPLIQRASAASKAGELAAQRMRLEHALGELER